MTAHKGVYSLERPYRADNKIIKEYLSPVNHEKTEQGVDDF